MTQEARDGLLLPSWEELGLVVRTATAYATAVEFAARVDPARGLRDPRWSDGLTPGMAPLCPSAASDEVRSAHE